MQTLSLPTVASLVYAFLTDKLAVSFGVILSLDATSVVRFGLLILLALNENTSYATVFFSDVSGG